MAAITPTPLSRIAGGAALLGGFFTILLGVQMASLFRMSGFPMVGTTLLFLLGGTLFVAGSKVLRLRGWACILGTVSGGIGFLFGMGWLVYVTISGVISLMVVAVPLLCAGAAVLCGLTITTATRADAARTRLRQHGFEAGN